MGKNSDEPPIVKGEAQNNPSQNAMGANRRGNANREKSERNMSVANTILSQLGGNRFTVMTGAKNYAAIDRGLQFDIGKNGSQANRVRVTLRGDDTYDMEFIKKGSNVNPYSVLIKVGEKYQGKVSDKEFNAIYERELKKAQKRAEAKVLKKYRGVYFDQLQPIFTQYTKMYTKL